MLPLVAPAVLGFKSVVACTVIVTPVHGLTKVKPLVPVHPFTSFAVIVYAPAARLLKIFDD